MPNTVLGKVTCTPKWDYAAGTSYEILDIVGYNGGSYMALKNDPEGAPSNDGVNWMQLAAKGGKGNTGAAAGFGDPTATVDQTPGTPSVTVEATGPNTAKVFSFAFSGIKGEQGIQGIQGETGETGEAAGFGEPTATVDNNVGTPGVTVTATGPDTAKVFSFAFVNLKGDQGEQGIQGVQGEQGEPGTSVASIQRTSGTGAPGTTDTYTMYDSNDAVIGTFQVYNGANGSGSGDLMADGSVPMTGALNMGGNKVTNLGAPGADTDAVRKQDLDAVAAEVDGILDGTTPAHLAPATETKIGGVIVGEGLSVTADGTLSADDQLPTNGTAGQVLTQTSTGPSWQDAPSGLPDGGTEGQILTQGTTGPEWADAPDPLPEGGTTGQLLTKTADGTAWQNKPAYTADEVGARPDTWTPTAEDVGARPDTWTPTASEVGAVPTSRTVNGKALSSNITLDADDVGALDQTSADARYLQLSGGTMTGALVLPGNPTSNNQAANKAYVDSLKPDRQTATLSTSGWSSNSQTITVNGVITNTSAQDIDISCADKASADAWAAGGVWCSNPTQANRLTFTCTTPPTANINLNIRLWEVGG